MVLAYYNDQEISQGLFNDIFGKIKEAIRTGLKDKLEEDELKAYTFENNSLKMEQQPKKVVTYHLQIEANKIIFTCEYPSKRKYYCETSCLSVFHIPDTLDIRYNEPRLINP
jgi:FtsZ-binding cell division protein ZapB